jgi:hypothetical protein
MLHSYPSEQSSAQATSQFGDLVFKRRASCDELMCMVVASFAVDYVSLEGMKRCRVSFGEGDGILLKA